MHTCLLSPREAGRIKAVHGVEVYHAVKPTDDVNQIIQRHNSVVRPNPLIFDVGQVPAIGPVTVDHR